MSKKIEHFVIFFDADCGVCDLSKRWLQKKEWTSEGSIQQLQDLEEQPDDLKCLIDPDKACQEIAVVDSHEKTVSYGWDGISKLILHKHPKWKFLNWMPFYFLFKFLYKLVAYNRYALLPAKGNTKLCQQKAISFFAILFSSFFFFLAFIIGRWGSFNPSDYFYAESIFMGSQFIVYLSLNRENHPNRYISSAAFVFFISKLFIVFINFTAQIFLFQFLIGYLLVFIAGSIWMYQRIKYLKNPILCTILWTIPFIIITTLHFFEINYKLY